MFRPRCANRFQGLGVSNTIRAACAAWAKTLARELAADGITVNNVLPGYTATDRLATLFAARAERAGKTPAEIEEATRLSVPAARFAAPEEIAEAVAFLASPAAGYITGVSLPVDGGRLHGI
ncbi:MAG TPA: SDR family oxidoreductase [Gammaproteobacteria bacterium]|nr:SDR family oxidoreductase [Gammaproteobacteria bacterium]